MENLVFTAFVRSCSETEFTTTRNEIIKGYNVTCEDDNHHHFYVWSTFEVSPTEIVKVKMTLKWNENSRRFNPSFKTIK